MASVIQLWAIDLKWKGNLIQSTNDQTPLSIHQQPMQRSTHSAKIAVQLFLLHIPFQM